ncbi:MAG: hypothetical protein IPF81_17960 [Bacteroidetes bacterium]|nr:hypothetical protein [Bacteroidota bacterium]
MNLKLVRSTFIPILLTVFAAKADAWFLQPKRNQLKNGVRHGYWVIYADSAKTILESRGHYRNGHETGTWKYYHENGKLRKIERFSKQRIRTKYFYENGKRKSAGNAMLRIEGESLHYFYQGPWKYYNEDGVLKSIVIYERGEEIKTLTK